MLTPEDLKNIGELMDVKLAFFEDRMDAKMDAKLDALEHRMDVKLNALDEKLTERIDVLSESVEEIRSTVNVLAAWADKTSKIVNVAF